MEEKEEEVTLSASEAESEAEISPGPTNAAKINHRLEKAMAKAKRAMDKAKDKWDASKTKRDEVRGERDDWVQALKMARATEQEILNHQRVVDEEKAKQVEVAAAEAAKDFAKVAELKRELVAIGERKAVALKAKQTRVHDFTMEIAILQNALKTAEEVIKLRETAHKAKKEALQTADAAIKANKSAFDQYMAGLKAFNKAERADELAVYREQQKLENQAKKAKTKTVAQIRKEQKQEKKRQETCDSLLCQMHKLRDKLDKLGSEAREIYSQAMNEWDMDDQNPAGYDCVVEDADLQDKEDRKSYEWNPDNSPWMGVFVRFCEKVEQQWNKLQDEVDEEFYPEDHKLITDECYDMEDEEEAEEYKNEVVKGVEQSMDDADAKKDFLEDEAEYGKNVDPNTLGYKDPYKWDQAQYDKYVKSGPTAAGQKTKAKAQAGMKKDIKGYKGEDALAPSKEQDVNNVKVTKPKKSVSKEEQAIAQLYQRLKRTDVRDPLQVMDAKRFIESANEVVMRGVLVKKGVEMKYEMDRQQKQQKLVELFLQPKSGTQTDDDDDDDDKDYNSEAEDEDSESDSVSGSASGGEEQ